MVVVTIIIGAAGQHDEPEMLGDMLPLTSSAADENRTLTGMHFYSNRSLKNQGRYRSLIAALEKFSRLPILRITLRNNLENALHPDILPTYLPFRRDGCRKV